jgi:hypothetical protein
MTNKWKRNAERYRWLRTAGAWESEAGLNALAEDPAAFDRAVDAAMAREAAAMASAAAQNGKSESSAPERRT